MCGRYGLWPKMYVDEMAVAEMVYGRYGRFPNNFSAREKGLLVDLVGRYAAVVECKKTDGSTMKEKEQAWMRVADEYSAGAETVRDWRALKTVR